MSRSHRTPTTRTLLLALGTTVLASQAHAYVFGDPIVVDQHLSLEFNARIRVEERKNTFDFNSTTNTVNDDTFTLTRFRAAAKYAVNPRLSFYAQLQDAREWDSKRTNVPYVNAAEGNDPADLRQLYVDFGDPRDDAFTARVGRQMLAYGDERLIGGFEWNNLARTFDALKFSYNASDIKTTLDAFAANVVTIEGRNQGDKNDLEFDNSDRKDVFAGLYAQNNGLVPNQKTDLYVLYRGKTRNGPFYRPNFLSGGTTGVAPYDIPEKIYTAGFRAQSLSIARLKGFDYLVEAAYQWGKSRPGLTNAIIDVPNWYDHKAYAFHAELGYTLDKNLYVPRFSAEYNLASGDTNPGDTKNEGFLNLFHTNHKFYGYMDVLGWKNMKNAALTARFKPLAFLDSSLKKSIFRVDYHWFWLNTTQDLWYRANAITSVAAPAASVRGSLPRDLGREWDFTWTWSPSTPYEFLVGYSYFMTGSYLPAARATGTTLGRADNAGFAYVQTVVKF